MRTVLTLSLACYPFLVYFLFGKIEHPYLIGVFALLIGLRLVFAPGLSKKVIALGAVGLLLFCSAAVMDPELTILKLYPVALNMGAAVFAGYTIIHPPSAIERLSHHMGVDVEGPAVPYTKWLTAVWLMFFVVNGVAAAYTALAASTGVWMWYNGFVSYLLIGLLIVGEYPVRLLYRRRHRPSEPW